MTLDLPTIRARCAEIVELEAKAAPGPWWNDGGGLFIGNGSDTWGMEYPAWLIECAPDKEPSASEEQGTGVALFCCAARNHASTLARTLLALIQAVEERTETDIGIGRVILARASELLAEGEKHAG